MIIVVNTELSLRQLHIDEFSVLQTLKILCIIVRMKQKDL